MAERQIQRPRKSQRRGEHVTLTSNEWPAEDEDTAVVVGSYLCGDAVSRSEMLAGLGQTDGSATLPDQLALADLQLWHAASVIPFEPTILELVTIIKVADVLGDRNPSWVEELSQRVVHHKWKTSCTICLSKGDVYVEEDADEDDDKDAAMLAALFQLPEHVLQGVLADFLDRHSLEEALARFPNAFHTALVAAAVPASGGALEIEYGQMNRFLTTLAATAVPAPGILSIQASFMNVVTLQSTRAALLARCLAAHPSLTTINIADLCLPAAALRTFAACLPPGALPALRTLCIGTRAHRGGCAALADCLRRLPAITSLHAHVHPIDADEPPPERPARNPYLRVASSPALLSDLRELMLTEEETVARKTSTCIWTRQVPHASCIFELLPMLKVPSLTSLSLKCYSCDIPAERFAVALRAWPALQVLLLKNHIRDFPCVAEPSGRPSNTPVTSLPHLRSLSTISSHACGCLEWISGLSCIATQSLTYLSVRTEHFYQIRELEPYQYGAKLSVLGTVTSLRHVELGLLPRDDMAYSPGYSIALWGAIRHLTSLTCLILNAVARSETEPCMVCAGDVAAAVLPLTALRRLHLGGRHGRGTYECSWLRVDEPQVLLDACTVMPQLRSLALGLEGLQREPVAAAVVQMTGLTELVLNRVLFPGGAEGDGGIGGLRGRLPRCTIELA